MMTRGVLSLTPEDSVRKAVELMPRYDVNGFPVLDRGKLVGMITQGDFFAPGRDRHGTRPAALGRHKVKAAEIVTLSACSSDSMAILCRR
jgi:CBS domain-containing protein